MRLSVTTLKQVAVVAMVADHASMLFMEPSPLKIGVMTAGKTAAPIMFFLLAQGYRHTGDLGKYMKRLLVAAFISQIPYSLFTIKGANMPLCANVMFTLSLSLTALYVQDKEKNRVIRWSVIFFIIIVSYFADWGVFGPLITLSFRVSRSRSGQIAAYLITSVVKAAVMYVYIGRVPELYAYMISPIAVSLLLAFYSDKKGSCRYRWAFYAIYPLQFICIYGLWRITRGGL